MTTLLACLFPISVFFIGCFVAHDFALNDIYQYYLSFILFFILSFFLALFLTKPKYRNNLSKRFHLASRGYLTFKVIVVLYYGLIFISYVTANGYENIRGFFASEQLQSSPFYFAPLTYLDAYVAVALDYIFLAFFVGLSNKRNALTLIALLIVQYAIFFAARGIFAGLISFFILHTIYQKSISLKKFVKGSFMVVLIFPLIMFMQINRDSNSKNNDDAISDRATSGILYYYVVPPLILDSISKNSEYYKTHVGYGFATFGFLTDPLVALLPIDNKKDFMPSKKLSAEAQNYILDFEGKEYNALASFLYGAIFDFGILGPVIYGMFFGMLLGHSYARRDLFGLVIYISTAMFVNTGGLIFHITGEWFWSILLSSFFIIKISKYGLDNKEIKIIGNEL